MLAMPMMMLMMMMMVMSTSLVVLICAPCMPLVCFVAAMARWHESSLLATSQKAFSMVPRLGHYTGSRRQDWSGLAAIAYPQNPLQRALWSSFRHIGGT